MLRSSSGIMDGADGLFGVDMWDLEVPTSPPLHHPHGIHDDHLHLHHAHSHHHSSSAFDVITPPPPSSELLASATPSPQPSSPSPGSTPTQTASVVPDSSSSALVLYSGSNNDSGNGTIAQQQQQRDGVPLLQASASYIPTAGGIKKRKPSTEFQEKPSSPVTWSEYAYGPKIYPVHDSLSFLVLNDQIDVVVQNVNSNCSYSQQDAAWICYRQNQFKVICLLRGPPHDTMVINDEGVPRKVVEICAKLYAVKEVAGVLGDEMRVGLHHVGKKRLKSAKMEVDYTPFVKGKIEFTNLQFEKSNSVKRPQQQSEYFHIVISIYARCRDDSQPPTPATPDEPLKGPIFHILSKISPKIIVRGQNPGFYEDKDAAACQSTHSPTNMQLVNNNNTDVNNTTTTTNNYNNLYNNVKYDNSSPSSNNSSPKDIANSLPLDTPINIAHVPSHQLPLHTSNTSINTATVIQITPPDVDMQQPTRDTYEQNQFTGLKRRGPGGSGEYLLKPKTEAREGGGREEGWQKIADTVYHHGKVGINTALPMEALTVNGNILVTGDVYKPSDRRIKTHIEYVDPRSQLEAIRNLKIYDYQVQNRQERGVLAQELQKVMPNSVHEVGDVETSAGKIPNLLVVNERNLLYENIGATQQLDKDLDFEKKNIVNIHAQMNNLSAHTTQSRAEMAASLQFMLDLLFLEEHKKKKMYAGLEEEFINFQFSVFRMGPARSLFLLGHFAPWLWVLGALYMFSNVRTRKCLGFMSFARLLLETIFSGMWTYSMIGNHLYTFNTYSAMAFAAIVLFINYRRLKRRLHPKQKKEKKKKEKKEKKKDKKKDKTKDQPIEPCIEIELSTGDTLKESKDTTYSEEPSSLQSSGVKFSETDVVDPTTTPKKEEEPTKKSRIRKALGRMCIFYMTYG